MSEPPRSPDRLALTDRAAPFSRKHRRYWLAVTGGMLFIGGVNIVLGYLMWPNEPTGPREQIELVLPKSTAWLPDAGVPAATIDATFDATPPTR